MSIIAVNNKTADVIKAELESLQQGEVFVWGRMSRLLDLIDKTGYWRNYDHSFTAWLQNNAPLLGIKISMAWRYLASGRFYLRLQQDFPFLIDKPLAEVSDELSPENLELVSRISRCAPDDIFKPLAIRVLSGKAKRSELRAAWLAFKPMLEGKTARGRGVVAHMVKPEAISENDQRLVTALMKNQLAISDSSWTKRGPLHINRVFFNISPSYDRIFDAVVVTRGQRSAFFLHGIKICLNSEVLSSFFIKGLKSFIDECDTLWLAFPSLPDVALIEKIPKPVGIITIDSNGIQTVRLPKGENRPGSTAELAKTLLEIILK